MVDPYVDGYVNHISKKERLLLKQSLLHQIIKILVFPEYGLFTEHGFPVAVATFNMKDKHSLPDEFMAEIIETNPMVTIYELP